jgi:hypothetical protein
MTVRESHPTREPSDGKLLGIAHGRDRGGLLPADMRAVDMNEKMFAK